MGDLISKHGGYRKLKTFQIAQLVYDITVRFSERYIDKFSRTRDQMVQAARSGVQNIAEGSQASGTSKKTELFLTNVARASLEELRLDYEDYLRQRKLKLWEIDDPRRKELVLMKPKTADEVAVWVRDVYERQSCKETYAEITCNTVLLLIGVTCSLLNRQISAQANDLEKEGGFSERLREFRKRKKNR
ncbi:MAG: four helix bundle suffix domain-containing protein [Sedimentisphaeraceae bacterium JB056]